MDKKPLLQPGGQEALLNDGYGSVQSSQEQPRTVYSEKMRWRSIYILYISMFFNSVGFSIVAVSLYPYLQQLDKTATVTFLGWTNTGFSFAQAVGSLIFGAWCLYRPAMESLVTSLALFAGGSLLYAYAPAFAGHGPEIILVGRIILGFSTGVIAVCRTVTSQMTTLKERASAMANLTLSQALGFLIGPAMQACMQPIGEEGIYYAPLRLYLNVYTAVGYLGVLISLVMLVLTACYFREMSVDIYQDCDGSDDASVQDSSLLSIVRVDRLTAGVIVVLFFVLLLVFALAETILSPLLMHEYAWSHDKVLLDGSLLMAGLGLMGAGIFALCGKLVKRFGEKKILIFGLVLLIIGYFLYLPWGDQRPPLQMTVVSNSTATGATSDTLPGCPREYKWCKTMPQLLFGQFLAAVIVSSIGYDLAVVMVGTLYSKVLGPSKQGIAMGVLSASGSLARTLGPMLISLLYTGYGPRWLFTFILACVVAGTCLAIGFLKRLVPYHVYARKRLLKAMA